MDIEKLSGVALDALVAEFVLGEPKPPHPGNDWYTKHPAHSSKSPGLASPQGRWYMTTASPDHEGGRGRWGGWMPHAYSSDDKLRLPFFHYILDAWSGDLEIRRQNGHWLVTIYRPSEEFEASGSTLPEALCRAALRAALANRT